MKKQKWWLPRMTVAAILFLGVGVTTMHEETGQSQRMTGHGDVDALKSIYQRWRSFYQKQGGDEYLAVTLTHSKALSSEPTEAKGGVTINLRDGTVRARVKGLPQGKVYNLWLVDNRPGAGRTVKPEEGDRFVRVGSLKPMDEAMELDAKLDGTVLNGFVLDLVAVMPEAVRPIEKGVIYGTPGLLQRLYYSDRSVAMGGIGDPTSALRERERENLRHQPFAFLLPKAAVAASSSSSTSDEALEALIEQGRQIFINENFDGNGRTCATCHRPDNNHTIDPKYISSLPKKDPLFVAENNPKLKDLENSKLLRQMGLILANVDGFDKPGVMRGVPHTLALATSICAETLDPTKLAEPSVCTGLIGKAGEFAEDDTFASATGWSGDGAPGTGSLREFAIGAVTQHLPKTLNRVEGKDFRLPTEEELDALEAYQLSLGRSEDINLAKMTFTSEIVQKGKKLFDVKENPVDANGQPIFGQTANCNGCHQNAGANSSTTQRGPTRDTGNENMRDGLAKLIDPAVPFDGGFGREEQIGCGPDDKPEDVCYGDGRFNTPPLVEAADTAPFFHNNSVSTIEEAVAFYNTEAFNRSPGSLTSSKKNRQVKIDSSQVTAVALFLRTLNALENIRGSSKMDTRALSMANKEAKELVRLAMADTKDAIEVLEGGVYNVYPEALERLREAYSFEKKAWSAGNKSHRNQYLNKAVAKKKQAANLMVTVSG